MFKRRSLRLKDYDYASMGMYFMTICTWRKEMLFGHVNSQTIELNDAGQIIHQEWLRSQEIRPDITLDGFVVMPNHFYGIVAIKNSGTIVVAHSCAPLHGLYRPPRSLGAIIAGFKSATTKKINELRNSPGLPVWQRNYYDHIIRNEADLGR